MAEGRDPKEEDDIENGWQHNSRIRNDSSAPEHSTDFDSQGVQIERDRPTNAQHVGLLAPDTQRAIWTNRARWFTGLAMIVDFVTGVTALVAGGLINSAAMVGFGLEAFVDLVASCFVLWRFWDAAETEEGARKNEDREQRANVLIAFIFIIIAVITCADAIGHLAEHKEPESGVLIIVFAVITMLLLGAIGFTKLYINRYVQSKALEQDAMASFATSAISVGLLVSAILFKINDGVWWLDAVWAIIVTIALAAYSIPILVKRRWWHKSFWRAWTSDS